MPKAEAATEEAPEVEPLLLLLPLLPEPEEPEAPEVLEPAAAELDLEEAFAPDEVAEDDEAEEEEETMSDLMPLEMEAVVLQLEVAGVE